MTTTNDNSLAFGYSAGLTPGTKAAWGARLIVDQDGLVDFLWDRQDTFGEKADRNALEGWLNRNITLSGDTEDLKDKSAIQRAFMNLKRLLIEWEILTREARPVILYSDREGVIFGNTNASCGYFYIAAYRFVDLPEGHPTKGLENVLA